VVTWPEAPRALSNLEVVLQAFGDGTIFGTPYGEGPVRVVWLHGWARQGQDFAAAAALLAERGVASLALDLPGFGASPAPATARGARQYAELVAPVLADLGGAPFVLVGHSFGGRIACVIAAKHSELVDHLVLTGVPLIRRGHSRAPGAFRLLRWMHRRGLVSEARMESARQKYGSTDYRNAHGVMRDVLVANVNESYEDELERISAPVTLLWGERDEVTPEDVATRASVVLRATHTLVSLPGVGHLLPTEAPADLATTVLGVARS
jgi:pimeloyl-ACP methyl ester carboxylesterase